MVASNNHNVNTFEDGDTQSIDVGPFRRLARSGFA
jgi:hypothetical protein